MKVIKILKYIFFCIGIVAVLFCFTIVSNCDYEDYCRAHGQPVETETNLTTAFYGMAVAIPAFGASFYLDDKDHHKND